MEKLKEILDQSLKRLDLCDRITDYGVWPIWNSTVGATVARNAQPEKIRNGTLFVKVTSPTWMQQLQYMKEMIVEKLNERMGRETVKNIFFVVGTVRFEEPAPEEPAEQTDPPPGPLVELPEKGLDAVHDPAVREALQRLYEALSRGRRG
ncbi:MAG TPA: DUF721 domain-containing protein [Candidatus Binatia bacterium]